MICSICNNDKHENDFYRKNDGGFKTTFCKKCYNLRYKDYRKKYTKEHQEQVRVWKQRDYIKNRITYIYGAARKRAIDNGLEFSITIDDIIIPEFCPILGIKIICDAGNGRTGNAPSIDRKDNTKGYTKDNIIIVSDRANKIKNDSSEDERAKLFYNVKKLLINQFFEDNNEENM